MQIFVHFVDNGFSKKQSSEDFHPIRWFRGFSAKSFVKLRISLTKNQNFLRKLRSFRCLRRNRTFSCSVLCGSSSRRYDGSWKLTSVIAWVMHGFESWSVMRMSATGATFTLLWGINILTVAVQLIAWNGL